MSVETEEATLESLSAQHLDSAVVLSRQAGWPHRPEDWAFGLEFSRGIVALRGERVVGTALASQFGEVATMNMIIVDSAMRGRGLGRRIMSAAMDLARVPEMRLVSTKDGLPLYRKLGFERCGEIQQYQGNALKTDAPDGVIAASLDCVETLATLDRAAYGAPRDHLIHRLSAIGDVALLQRNEKISGFAICRTFGRGKAIGPVIAENPEDALRLVTHFVAAQPGAFLRIDIPEEAGIGPALEGMGLVHAGGGIAMRRGTAARTEGPVRTFGLVNQAFG